MRILIFTVDQVYSNYLLKSLIKFRTKDKFFIVESGVLLSKKSLGQSLYKYLVVSGLYYVFIQALKLYIYKFSSLFITKLTDNSNNKFYSYKALANNKNFKIIKSKDVNNDETIKVINNYKPDLIISIFFNQIIKSRIISIPKYGVINIHPSYLPDYKGMSPTFWAMANDEKKLGVSIHFIDEGIDTGKIISRKKIDIYDDDSEDTLYWRCTLMGSKLVNEILDNIKNLNSKTMENKGGKYFSIPSKDAVSKFRNNGKSFYHLKEYLNKND